MLRPLLFVLTIGSALLSLAQKIEAEGGSLTGTIVANSRTGFSGDGYVTGFDEDGDAVSVQVTLDNGGLYDLWIAFAAPNGEKTNDIHVNGDYVGSQIFPSSQAFDEGYFGKVFLKKGTNSLKVVKNWGYFEVDYFRISPTSANEIHNYKEQLVTSGSSYEAETLYLFLRDYYGHRIISGQQADAGGENELEYIQQQTGKLPAIKGFDLIDYSPTRVANGTTSRQTELAIDWWQQDRGIVSLMWHWNAPKDLLDTDDAPWWSGFYTYATTFDPTIAMNDPNSEEYELILSDIDVIAEELKELQEAKVPVLWRPLHEAEGGWFWWGSQGPEVCVWLWKVMYDRLTNHHGLDNMIWVWTGTDSADALEWYPGDDYVDIVGADIYLENGNYATSFSMFDNMAGIHEGQKIITLSETGTIPDASDMDDQKARWSWFVVWSGDFIMDGVKNDVDHLITTYQHEYVITLDELPDFYNYVSPDFADEGVLSSLPGILEARVYPNPTSDYLYLESNFDVQQIKVYDLQGSEMRITSVSDGRRQLIDMRSLNSGVYLVRVWTAQGPKGFKVVVR